VSDYGTLKTEIEGYLWDKASAQVPNFINGAIRTFTKKHDFSTLEEISTRLLVINEWAYALPNDFNLMRELQLRKIADDTLIAPLYRIWPPEKFFRLTSIADYGSVMESFVPVRVIHLALQNTPAVFTEYRNEFYIFPKPDAANVAANQMFMLYKKFHSGYSGQADEYIDWFLVNAYDALKWGALIQGAPYLRDSKLKQSVLDLYQDALRDVVALDIEAETAGAKLWMGT
jgi:hypothetical protein